MTKRILCLILCIGISLTLSGCYGREEPKTLAIVLSSLYDIKDDGSYQVTAEIINPAAHGGPSGPASGKNPTITAVSEGKSIPEAVKNVSESLEKTIFSRLNEVRFFSEEFAKKNMVSVMDFFTRDHLTDEYPLIVIIKDEDPKRIYSSMLGLSDTVGDYFESLSIQQPNTISRSVFIDTLEFIKDYYEDGKQPVAGVAELVECEDKPSEKTGADSQTSQGSEDNKKYKIKYEGLAAFKDGKLVGYMDGIETRSYNLIMNKIKSANVSIPSGDDFTVITIKNSKSDIKTTIKNDQIAIDVKIKMDMSIIQEGGVIDISKSEPLKEVEDSINKKMKEEITASIKKAQTEFQSDIFGFGKAVHIQHPQKWEEIKESWDDYFAKASINVTVESSADRSGEIKQPFRMVG